VRDDIVFIDPIIGVGELAISDHRSSQPTLDELLRIAADCHVGGLMSNKAGVLHLHLGDGTRGLDLVRRALEGSELPARVFHPTHVNRQPRLFEEAMALAGRGVTLDVTAFPPADDDPALSAVAAIEAWLDAKLPAERLTCSSDGAGCLPVFDGDGRLVSMDIGQPSTLALTLATLLRRRDPTVVLPMFTSNVAKLLRLPRKGQLEPGFDADLVVLDEIGMPRDVMARGRWLVRGGKRVVYGPFERKQEQ
jgi:beta-aspartyl-dipeptidase (metallo-type)